MIPTSSPGTVPPSRWRRSLLAFVLAPPLGMAVYGVLFGLTFVVAGGAKDGPEILGAILGGPIFLVLFGSLFAYFGALIFGIPIWLMLRRTRSEHSINYAILGFLAGLLIPPIKNGGLLLGPSSLENGIGGLLVMLSFWWIACGRRR